MTAFLIITGVDPAERDLRRGGVRDRRRAARRDRPEGRTSGNRLARAVQRVFEDPQKQDRYIATAQLGITVASLGLGMYGEHVLADCIYDVLGAPRRAALARVARRSPASIAVAILTYFHIVVGEMVPKSLALQCAETMALWITPPMLWTQNAAVPVRRRAERARQSACCG